MNTKRESEIIFCTFERLDHAGQDHDDCDRACMLALPTIMHMVSAQYTR